MQMRVTFQQYSSIIKPRISTTHPTPYSWINNAVAGPSTGPLAGKNIAIKDNISYSKAPTSCSSKLLEDYHPPYNATCVASLISAGAHITGQTKMDEFGMGSQTTHLPSHYTPVYNPAFPKPGEPPRVAGGSSGGSAAAVAEGSCWAALGTDTGGSVRLPASYCGVVGLKPSYGMISRHGVVAYADSLDCVGVLGKTVDIVKSVFDNISHPDDNDMTCLSTLSRQKAKLSYQNFYPPSTTDQVLSEIRIGLISPGNTQTTIPNVPSPLKHHLKSLGASIHTIPIPNLSLALPAYYVLASAEAASNLGRYGGGWFGSTDERLSSDLEGSAETGEERRRRIRGGFGREVKKRILAGTYALTADAFNNSYLKALHLRRLLREDFNNIFRAPHPLYHTDSQMKKDGIDILLHPTAIRTAPLHPDSISSDGSEKGNTGSADLIGGTQEYLQDLLTVPASLAGLPAISVPAAVGDDGWPIGVSLMGQWGMEELVFRAAKGVESWDTN